MSSAGDRSRPPTARSTCTGTWPRSGSTSITYCARLLAEADVAITPGTDFDGVHGHDWVRLSFASSLDTVTRAVDRIVAWHKTL